MTVKRVLRSVLEVDELVTDESKAFRRFVNNLTRDNLWVYILRLLQEGPKYGYEIRAMINERFGFRPATVTSYVILYKMANDGLVKTEKELGEGKGKPDRKYYVMTDEGKRVMKAAKVFVGRFVDNVFDLT
jgi:DNA-binding PadR family transcriptional regulator